MRIKKWPYALLLLILCLIVINDSAFHFDRERVALKRSVTSAQRHWSLFYPQRYTYQDTSFKYDRDYQVIRDLIEPETTVLTDRATSYYLAAELPMYTFNVHGHHGRHTLWTRFLSRSFACYIDQDDSFDETQNFIEAISQHAEKQGEPSFKYWVLNRDLNNLNVRGDCLAARGSGITKSLPKFAKQIYQGEYLWLYELD